MTKENYKDVTAKFDKAEAAFADGRFSDAVGDFRWAAEQGHPVAPWALAAMYVLGLGVERDEDRVRYWFRRGEDWGHYYGDEISYDRSAEGVVVPDEEVLVWIRRAAEHNHPEAQFQLGRMYVMAYGVSQDFTAAMSLYRKAAEQGHAEAMRGIARLYFRGDGVSRSRADGELWKEKAEAAESLRLRGTGCGGRQEK